MIWWILIIALIGVLAYVRLAPSDPAHWNAPIAAQKSEDGPGYAQRTLKAAPGLMEQLDHILRNTARTRVLAGSLDTGRITYITRSAVIGFPDYTTIEESNGEIKLFARLRFGKSDFGVNAARLEQLVAQIQP